MRLLVRCVHGVEWVAAAELADVFGVDGRLARREVVVDLPAADARVLDLRCVDDAFVLVGDVPADDPTRAGLAPLGAAVAGSDWPSALAGVRALREAPPAAFDVVVSIEGRRSHNRFAAEDAVGAALAPVLGLRHVPRDRAAASDLTVRVFLRPGVAVVALRVAPRPLHRRAWKQDTGPGTLHPPLAAALAAIGGAGPGRSVRDPFCGDGTLAVEAARRGAGVRAADLDPARVAATRANAARAGVDVAVAEADAADLDGLDVTDLLLANPPWSRAVTPAGRLSAAPAAYWTAAGAVLRGRAAVVTDADLEVPDVLAAAGWSVVATRVRLAGRVAHLTLAAPPGAPPPVLPERLARWRRRALEAGVVTADGF